MEAVEVLMAKMPELMEEAKQLVCNWVGAMSTDPMRIVAFDDLLQSQRLLAVAIGNLLKEQVRIAEARVWEEAAKELYNRHVSTCKYLLADSTEPCPCQSIMPTYDEFRRRAQGDEDDAKS